MCYAEPASVGGSVLVLLRAPKWLEPALVQRDIKCLISAVAYVSLSVLNVLSAVVCVPP